MLTMTVIRTAADELRFTIRHHDYKSRPPRSWVVVTSTSWCPPHADAKDVARLVAYRILGPDFHEAYAAPVLAVGEQLELFQCLPGSHRPEERLGVPTR